MASVAEASPAAEKLFQDGRKLLAEGKLDEACDALRASQQLEPRTGTLLNLGDCEEKRGKLATAWSVFVEARALARKANDPRAAEAERRANALAPKLPYLTISVAGATPGGLVVRRGEAVVPVVELGRELPIDPGHYALEVTAPGHRTWSGTVDVAPGQRARVEVPALVADPSAGGATGTTTTTLHATATEPQAPPSTAAAVPPTPPVALSIHVGVGGLIGVSSDSDLLLGARVPVQLARLGRGALRVVPSLLYTSMDDGDPYHEMKLYAFSGGIEYVHPIAPVFVLAGGIGLGLDYLDDNYAGSSTYGWGALRLSPTLRLGPFDLGLHLQLVRTSSNTVGLGELGLDYHFF